MKEAVVAEEISHAVSDKREYEMYQMEKYVIFQGCERTKFSRRPGEKHNAHIGKVRKRQSDSFISCFLLCFSFLIFSS
jgi:hypothetical protein